MSENKLETILDYYTVLQHNVKQNIIGTIEFHLNWEISRCDHVEIFFNHVPVSEQGGEH